VRTSRITAASLALGSKKTKSLVDRARKGSENDVQECLQFPPCLASLFELESAFHVI
jgi:hypothetical protein